MNGSFHSSIQAALNEDIGSKDLSSSFIPPALVVKADAIFKQKAVLSGITIAEQVFRQVDEELRFLPAAKDGEIIEDGRVIFYVEGRCRSILAAERTALNFLGHLSGISTLTRQFVDRVRHTNAKIYDTRKTTPLLRSFERYAVRTGGGVNHRFGLYDGVLIKDNHLRAVPRWNFKTVLKETKSKVSKRVPLGLEVQTVDQFREALPCGFHYILLDHFSVEDVAQCVQTREKQGARPEIEVSGNIDLENVRAYAEAGPDRISVGALTHSAKAADISLNLLPS